MPVTSRKTPAKMAASTAAAAKARQDGELRRRTKDSSSPSAPSTPVFNGPPTEARVQYVEEEERYNNELKQLAEQAKADAVFARRRMVLLAKVVGVITLLAVAAWASQLSLAPVYGGLPAARTHIFVIGFGCFVGWALNADLTLALDRAGVLDWFGAPEMLPVFTVYAPLLHLGLERFSDFLGIYGPLVTEMLTLFPLAALSAATVADCVVEAKVDHLIPRRVPGLIADSVPGLGIWLLYIRIHALLPHMFNFLLGQSIVFTAIGLQALVAVFQAVLAPSALLVVALPGLFHTAMFNYHVQNSFGDALVNSTLVENGWRILEREHSVTGYVSVLENIEAGYRVMRCDHSLLGGEWVADRGSLVAEPVYGVFAMLEAVRLINRLSRVPDDEANALVIGLGVGTTPSALVTHGIKTTVVEIDPVVHKYAQKYFGLRENTPAIIDDAVSVVGRLVDDSPLRFDYIIHDVFTGGAEPEALFTGQFLADLGSLLNADGVIALNYAGDMTLDSTKSVIGRIKQTFRMCRMFREYPPDAALIATSGTDFANGVLFCTNHPYGIDFDTPNEDDYLRTYARQQFLMPKHEVDMDSFLRRSFGSHMKQQRSTWAVIKEDYIGPLWQYRKGKTGPVKRVTNREEAAFGHWKIMRTVVPPRVWELW